MIWYDMIWYDAMQCVMCDVIWYMIWCDIWYYMIWYMRCDKIYDMMWYICDVMWYDMWYDVIYDIIWYDICDVMWYDIRYDVIYMWCDVMCYDILYDIWCDVIWNYNTWRNILIYNTVSLNCSKNEKYSKQLFLDTENSRIIFKFILFIRQCGKSCRNRQAKCQYIVSHVHYMLNI